jgi:hypothetical protein
MAQRNQAGKGMTMEQTSEARLREALERLIDTLDGLRNGTLTKQEPTKYTQLLRKL